MGICSIVPKFAVYYENFGTVVAINLPLMYTYWMRNAAAVIFTLLLLLLLLLFIYKLYNNKQE